MLISPKGFNFLFILSISLLSAVIWITADDFVSSNTTGLNFLQAFKHFSILFFLPTILNRALFKIVGKKNKIEKCLNACKKFNPVVLDETKSSAVIQITALRREIDKMNKKLKPLGLISTSRTGAVAMTRGAKIFN